MKNLNTVFICASTVLFANSVSADWSVGGFVGQSSINGCRPISIPTTISGPVSTLTTSTFDTAAFNEALSSITNSVSFEDNIIFSSFVVSDPFDSPSVIEFFNRAEDFTTVTQTSFIGDFPDLEATINTTNETVVAADFTANAIPTFEIADFNPSDLGEFINGATTVGTGTTAGDIIQSFTNSDDNITQSQSLDVTNQLFECNTGDDDDFGFGLNIAYNFTKNWGIEAGYVDLGEFSATLSPQNVDVINPTNIDVDASAFYLAGTASYYYSKKWSVTGRLGAYQIDIDRRLSSAPFSLVVETGSGSIVSNFGATSSTTSFKDEDVYYGASLNYDFNEKFQVQLRYDDFDIDLISLGLRYSL